MGKFFGLRGCEEDVDMEMDAVAQGKAGENGNGENMSESEDELLRQMELEWQQALQRAYAEESHRWNLK